jgi:hypothetical protein
MKTLIYSMAVVPGGRSDRPCGFKRGELLHHLSRQPFGDGSAVLCGWTTTGLLETSCVGISDRRKSMTLFTLARYGIRSRYP